MLDLEKFKDERVKWALSVKNLKTGETINVNENTAVPSASTIKVFIMGEGMRQVKEGKLSLNQRFSVREEDKVPFSIVTMLNTENTYTLQDLITLMIVQSDNTATNMLIDILGMDNINKFIKSFEFEETVLQRKMMDFNARVEGRENYTSAHDTALYLEKLYNGQVVDEEHDKLMIHIMKRQLDNSMMRMALPDELKIAHKTGELDYIDHDIGIVFADNCDYVFSMLTWDAETNNLARFKIGDVAKEIYDYFVKGE